jgi:23S rRNA (pseudouridine1915-N3)-methyltransferase
MKIHIVTIGQPKLKYAKDGWEEYTKRLSHYHQLRTTHIADKHNDAEHFIEAIGNSYLVVMEITGKSLTSRELSDWLEKRAIDSREVCFVIGGPDGIPEQVIDKADFKLSLGSLTYPHDLAMVILSEALYRASTIAAGQPYHR